MDPSYPPPPSPSPWRWQCHRCRIWYTLSCTRRCLSCSHVFCQETLNGHHRHHNNNTTVLPSSPRLRRQSQIRARRRTKKKGGPCTSKFDFDGWAAWGSWRRMTLLRRRSTNTAHDFPKSHVQPLLNRREYITTTSSKSSRKKEMEAAAYMTWKPKEVHNMHGTKLPKRHWAPRYLDSQSAALRGKEEMYLFAEHDCSLHCDYPNECGHTVYAAAERERERIRMGVEGEEKKEEEEDEVLMPWSTGAEFEIYCDPVLATDGRKGVHDDDHAHGKKIDMESGGDTEDVEEPDELDEKAAELASLLAVCTDSSPKSSERGITGHAEADEYLDWISNEWDE
ncbi:hypothetical protein GE09DRAFT_1232050 [Coniochaeta sp. 2T2.1]|nr:hypothetical protein GE09DRAFT_1232050 [Coniochaeta sp. 2T2.1]